MSINQEAKRKIKIQKMAALFLIVLPAIKLIYDNNKNGLQLETWSHYVSIIALLVLIGCGALGLRNSLRKQKSLRSKV